MSDELSTSALLRQTQAALAASQADLTQREEERNAAASLAVDLLKDIERLEGERDLTRAELASARQALDQLRAAHDRCSTKEV
jgi:uncharacterized protein (DUF1800 family)